MFTTTEENKVILAECQQSFEYLTTRHCSLVNINTILCADILKPLKERKSKTKNKKACDNTNNRLRHIALKGLPIMLKATENLSTFNAILCHCLSYL